MGEPWLPRDGTDLDIGIGHYRQRGEHTAGKAPDDRRAPTQGVRGRG